LRARNSDIFCIPLLLSRHASLSNTLSTDGNRSNYPHDFFVDTPRSSRYVVYPRHATIFVLADASAASTSMWRPSDGGRCSGRWYEMRMNNRRWELVFNHPRAMLLVISPSLHGWHLSSNLRTFLARLIVPFSSSELDVRATAHIQRRGQSPRGYGIYLRCYSLPGLAAPTGPWRAPHRRAGRGGGRICSGYQ
jgi:hypothetical protein